jgi:thioredoxin 1
MNPILDEIQKEFPDLEIVKINVDEDAGMVNNYNIQTVPTYILIKDDGEILSFVKGAMPKYKLLKELGIA